MFFFVKVGPDHLHQHRVLSGGWCGRTEVQGPGPAVLPPPPSAAAPQPFTSAEPIDSNLFVFLVSPGRVPAAVDPPELPAATGDSLGCLPAWAFLCHGYNSAAGSWTESSAKPICKARRRFCKAIYWAERTVGVARQQARQW